MTNTTRHILINAATLMGLAYAPQTLAQDAAALSDWSHGARETAPQARLSLRIPFGGDGGAADSRYAPRLQFGVKSAPTPQDMSHDWARRAPTHDRSASLGFTLQGTDSQWLLNDAPIILETGETAHVSDGVKFGAGVLAGVALTGVVLLALVAASYEDDES